MSLDRFTYLDAEVTRLRERQRKLPVTSREWFQLDQEILGALFQQAEA